MKKAWQDDYLKSQQRKQKRKYLCEKGQHDEDMWCNHCIRKPELVSQELPDGTITHGYLITNSGHYSITNAK